MKQTDESSNRTFMELKQDDDDARNLRKSRSNRTFMELKQRTSIRRIYKSKF